MAEKNQTIENFHELRQAIQQDFKIEAGTLYEKFHEDLKLLSEQFEGLNQRLGEVERKTDIIMETAADIKVDTTNLREDITEKADEKELEKLEHRVVILEARRPSPYRDTGRTWTGILSKLVTLIKEKRILLPDLKDMDSDPRFQRLGRL